MKTRYFNTGFVSLQYKNTNQYYAKLIQKNIWENHKFLKRFLKFFDLIFLGAGSNAANVAGLDPANPARSPVQTSDLAGEPKAHMNLFTRACTGRR